MGIPRYPKEFGTEWQKTQRKIKSNFTSGNTRTGSTIIATDLLQITGQLTISAGGKFIGQYANGVSAFYIGPVTNDGLPGEGVVIRRADGSEVLHVEGISDNQSSWSLQDPVGNVIVTDSPVGLGRPYLNVPFGNVVSTFPGTTSGTFTTIHAAYFPKHHPSFRMHLAYNIAATTGEIQIKVTDVTGTNVVVTETALSSTGNLIETFDMPGEFLEVVYVEVQSRVATGAGNAGVQVLGAYGLEPGA